MPSRLFYTAVIETVAGSVSAEVRVECCRGTGKLRMFLVYYTGKLRVIHLLHNMIRHRSNYEYVAPFTPRVIDRCWSSRTCHAGFSIRTPLVVSRSPCVRPSLDSAHLSAVKDGSKEPPHNMEGVHGLVLAKGMLPGLSPYGKSSVVWLAFLSGSRA